MIANKRAIFALSIYFLIWEISMPPFKKYGARFLYISKCYRKGMELIPKEAFQIQRIHFTSAPQVIDGPASSPALASLCAPDVCIDSEDSQNHHL